MVPMDQPRASLEMITRFIKGMPLDEDPPFTRVVTDSSEPLMSGYTKNH